MKYFIFSLSLLGVAFLSGCNTQKSPEADPVPTAQVEVSVSPSSTESPSAKVHTPEPVEPLVIETSFYPLAFFAEQITQDLAKVNNLSAGRDPHSYTLSPQDRVRLDNADIFLYQGLGLESWAEDISEDLVAQGVLVKETSEGIAVQKNTSEENHEEDHEEEGHQEHSDEHDDHDDHKEESHDEHEEHSEKEGADEHNDEEHHEHDHGEFDPHTWLDPVLAQQMVQGISAVIQKKDPQNASIYIQNTNKLLEELGRLDAEYTRALANCKRSDAVVSHDAFGYLESRYGFQLHPIAGLAPSDEPSAKLLSQLKHIVEEKGITHILSEENNVKKYSQTLSAETGVALLPIHPLGTVPHKGSYFDIARQNLASFSEALGCQ